MENSRHKLEKINFDKENRYSDLIISTWNNQVKLVRFRGHPQQISVMLNIFWSLRGWRFG